MPPFAQPGPTQARWQTLLHHIQAHLHTTHSDPARSVVLLPFAQLLPLARQQWALAYPSSLLPRFETTSSWAQRLCPFAPDANDLAYDAARDLLTAQRLLQQAGLAQHAQWLASRLREAALQLAPLAASHPPAQRDAWAAQMQRVLQADAPAALHYEQAIAAIALAWAGHSAFATDALFDATIASETQALVLLRGLQHDALAERLVAHMAAHRPQAVCMLDLPDIDHVNTHTLPPARLHMASHMEDQAQRAAACVQRAVEQEQGLVALVDNDRALTRRIRAILEGQGLALRDETGWKLSTTHAASQVMCLLRACAPQATSDAVLAWLKLAQAAAWPPLPQAGESLPPTPTTHSAILPAHTNAIEAHLRHNAWPRWPDLRYWQTWPQPAATLAQQIVHWRQQLQAPRALAAWLADLRQVLEETGQWPWLAQDLAGQAVLQALHWQTGAESLDEGGRWSLGDFTQWVAQVLEAGHFTPAYPLQEQVAVVPLGQLLARPFAAVVMPGCDEQRLPASPELPGQWTAAQRATLGLPDRAQAQQAQRHAWISALAYPQVDLLVSHSDGGAPLLPSPLLLEWQWAASVGQRAIAPADDPRVPRAVPAQPHTMPQPRGDALPVQRLSASSYDALRACPYRFFALHQLQLRETPELVDALDKRDFGNWLHRTLRLFHESLAAEGMQPADVPHDALEQRLNSAAEQAQHEQHLDAAAFLPFQLTWPQVRAGYLRWLLVDYAPYHAQFVQGEAAQQRLLADALQGSDAPAALPPQPVQLTGTIDRIDRLPAPGAAMLLDYKTEDPRKTAQRIRSDGEDTQLPFYAALLAPDAVRVAYLNIGEKGHTTLHEQPDAAHLGQQLLHGMAHDLARMAQGAPLPALGQGARCDFCAARGLCRRDFWEGAA